MSSPAVQRAALVAALLASGGCARPTAPPPVRTRVDVSRPMVAKRLAVTLVHDSAAERATRDQLFRLQGRFDLGPWLLTTQIAIDEAAIPHSHPVLTLHTRHLKDDDQLLSTFIHEEMHWRLEAMPAETEAAVAELRAAFPVLPVGFPDGATSERSSYEHLVVILLEYQGLARLVGQERADRTFAFWEGDHYRVLYRLVRENRDAVETIARRHRLAS